MSHESSSAVSNEVIRLRAENEKLREALTLALGSMNYLGDILNGMDAVTKEDVAKVTPAFEAARAALGEEQKNG